MSSEFHKHKVSPPDDSGLWEWKCWGWVRHDFSNESYCTSHLEIVPRWRSSIHHHQDRHNLFLCVDATIAVETFGEVVYGSPPNKDLGAIKIVGPGQIFSVPHLHWHRFRTMNPGRVIELYWAERHKTVRLDDIVRHDKGGPDL